MYIVQFGGYTLPTEQLEMSESQGATRRGSTTELGGAGGSFDNFGAGTDPLAEDMINKGFIIEATSGTFQTALDNFLGEMMLSQNDWRQGARVLVAQLPDATKRQTWAKCIEARLTQEYFNVNNYWGKVDVTWRRSWPVWEKFEDIIYLGDHLGTFDDTDTAGYDLGASQNLTEETVSSSPHTFTITNGGKARVMAGVIEFDGAITNPKLENLTNKYEFQWTGSLSAGDRLTLYVAQFDARENGAGGEWANITLGSENGQILPMVLEPGANSMRITGTGPSCTFRYYWARAYM